MEEHTRGNCSRATLHAFSLEKNSQMMQVNGLIVINAIFATIMVGIVTFGPRYRHRGFIRLLFQGATTLFLPALSYVVSNGSSIASSVGTRGQSRVYNFLLPSEHRLETLQSMCFAGPHLGLILLWANLVQIVEINTCAVVAADDSEEGRNIGLPMVLATQLIWTSYLAVYNAIQFDYWVVYSFLLALVIVFAKMALKYYAFRKARTSFALGRNPRLVVGYMEQLQEANQHIDIADEYYLPPLIVMGEDRQLVEKQPRGYRMKNDSSNNNLVTIDKIWHLELSSVSRIKDICLSFALFKLLRCRFAGYTASEAGLMEAQNFFWHGLLKDGDAERLFRVFEDELSFLHDYYYLSLPISYSKSWIPISNIVTSLLTIVYSLLLVGLGLYFIIIGWISATVGQITCIVWCNNVVKAYYDYFNYTQIDRIEIGNVCCDLVPVFVLVALVVLSEMKDSASYIFGNWTKVALICCHVLKKCNETRQQQSMCSKIQGWVISRVLKCRFKFMKHWDDKMNQSSLLSLPHHQRHQKKRVKVPGVVKVAIVEALKRRSRDGAQVVDYLDILRRGMPGGDRKFLWACGGEGTVDIILVWHIATAIVEVRQSQQPVSSDNKIVATRLSQYCAYLVAYVPGLLPDDDPWCRQVYEAVKKDSTRVLAGRHQVTKEYDQLLAVLTDRSEHEVLKKGVRLGKQLAEGEQQEMVWRLLAGFWSAMVLGVAPSGRLSEHAEAVARGGELVTLLWALQMHAGTGPPDASSAESAV